MTRISINVDSSQGDVDISIDSRVTFADSASEKGQIAELLEEATRRIQRAYGFEGAE